MKIAHGVYLHDIDEDRKHDEVSAETDDIAEIIL